ncbi:MAG: hypothetical protein WBB45_17080 [Cyclobacteriaceae bacterium]
MDEILIPPTESISEKDFWEALEAGRSIYNTIIDFPVEFELKEELIAARFFGVVFKEKLTIKGSEDKASGIYLRNTVFEKDVVFLSLEVDRIQADDCEFKHCLNLRGSVYSEDSSLERCVFGELYLSSVNFQALFLIDVIINGAYIIDRCEFASSLLIRNTRITSGFEIRNNNEPYTFCQDLYIERSAFNSSFYILNAMVDRMTIIDSVIQGQPKIQYFNDADFLKISGLKTDKPFKVYLNDNVVRSLIVDPGKEAEGKLVVWKGSINYLSLIGGNQSLHITFDELFIYSLNIDSFINNYRVNFLDCKAKKTIEVKNSKFTISESDLGITAFYDCDFSAFHNFKIKYSTTNQVVLRSTKLFSAEKKLIKSNSAAEQRDVYQQLKHASNNQGNRIQALEFQAREYRAYKRGIKDRRPWWHGDRWILLLSQTNDYGLNWQKPVLLSAVWTLLIYTVIVLSLDTDGDNLSLISQNWQVFWQLFNPAHRLESLFLDYPNCLTGWTYFWDFLHRLGYTFLIYQIISAFRKFYKK